MRRQECRLRAPAFPSTYGRLEKALNASTAAIKDDYSIHGCSKWLIKIMIGHQRPSESSKARCYDLQQAYPIYNKDPAPDKPALSPARWVERFQFVLTQQNISHWVEFWNRRTTRGRAFGRNMVHSKLERQKCFRSSRRQSLSLSNIILCVGCR